MDTNFLIIVTVYNCEKYIGLCLRSILSQEYKNFKLVVVDDCSTDSTSDILRSWGGFKYYRNQLRSGSAVGNIVKAIKMCPGDSEDVIVIVDGDDWLYDDKVLGFLNRIYQKSYIWLTYGQFTSVSGQLENFCRPLLDTRNYRRKGAWYTSHPKTMKRWLWDKIKEKDLKDSKGNFFKRFEDISYMYCALEMAGVKHIMFINRVLYVYNDRNNLCSLNEYKEKQRLREIMPIKAEIIRKPVYNEIS